LSKLQFLEFVITRVFKLESFNQVNGEAFLNAAEKQLKSEKSRFRRKDGFPKVEKLLPKL